MLFLTACPGRSRPRGRAPGDVAHLLEPHRYEERTGGFSIDKVDMRRWLRRLGQ
ncbi:hypothetical protein ACLESD_11875 [Pyxidicoccus sp. 3LFB2]